MATGYRIVVRNKTTNSAQWLRDALDVPAMWDTDAQATYVLGVLAKLPDVQHLDFGVRSFKF